MNMLTAWYIGDHKEDGQAARLGVLAIRFGQIGQKWGRVTHCEAILMGPWHCATIASASLRDGGVRIKTTDLNPAHWIILDVPVWDVVSVAAWFERRAGTPYSTIGAMSSASMLIGAVLKLCGVVVSALDMWCSRALGDAAGVGGAEDMSVSELMALAMALPGTRDVTPEYFDTRKP
jgi:hypothetical protein